MKDSVMPKAAADISKNLINKNPTVTEGFSSNLFKF